MHQILLVIQVLVAVALVGLVLLQQGRGADAGASFGGGASGSLFGSRGPASFLAKMTAALAAVFFANSLGLAYIAGRSGQPRSVIERTSTAPASTPSAPVVPPAPETGSTGDVPSAPSVPSVPPVGGSAPDVPQAPVPAPK